MRDPPYQQGQGFMEERSAANATKPMAANEPHTDSRVNATGS
jgi:hypothetical protein